MITKNDILQYETLTNKKALESWVNGEKRYTRDFFDWIIEQYKPKENK
jgi:hypothetical protein